MDTVRARSLGVLFIGVGLIALGALFLLGQIFHLNVWAVLWPFFIIVPGLLFFVGMAFVGRGGGPLAVPGSIVTMVGVLLLYQALTNHWESWAYAWALVAPTSVGIGIAIAGLWGNDSKAVRAGAGLIVVGLVIFLIFGVFFELILNISGMRNGSLGRLVLPLMLIGAGAIALVWALLPRKHRPS